jgi:transposase
MRGHRHLKTRRQSLRENQESTRAKAASKVTTWEAVTNQILALREHLISDRVTLVVMEATSDYWKPFYYLLEEGPLEIMPVNARHVKNLPGRKTNVSPGVAGPTRRARFGTQFVRAA